MTKKNIAIIGAGISGLICAAQLHNTFNVTLFEKSRGISGRTSTRYADIYEFDHGAPYITARTEKFKEFMHQLCHHKIAAEWNPKIESLSLNARSFKRTWFETHYVGWSRMNDIAKYLYKNIADMITLHLNTEIQSVANNNNSTTLTDKNQVTYDNFDAVILTAPAPQTLHLLPDHVTYRPKLDDILLAPAYCLMLGSPDALKTQTGLFICDDPVIDKIIVNSDKPHRPSQGTSLLIQSQAEWALKHIDDDIPEKQAFLRDYTLKLLNMESLIVNYISTHRWRYAKTSKPINESFLWDTVANIGVCADWCQDAEHKDIQGVEAAFLSAEALSNHLLVNLNS